MTDSPPGQSYDSYVKLLRSGRVPVATGARRVLYLVPLGEFAEGFLGRVREFLAWYWCVGAEKVIDGVGIWGF
jgi:hypothetical protein